MDDYSRVATQSPVHYPPSTGSWYRLPFLLLVLFALLVLAFLPTYIERLSYSRTKAEVAAISDFLATDPVAAMAKTYTMVARKVSPSVVHIETERRVLWRGDELAMLFGPQLRQQQGQASGVIVDPAGYIVTNYHVIANATDVRVRLPDGTEYDAEVIGSDPKNDLAVIKIEGEHLIAAPWGDSNALDVGEMVWAIGNPFGLDNTLTSGIVSAKDRRGVNAASRYQEYLQTDAAVNPGNSGGPLVNIMGEIVGINTAIIGPLYSGVSFAIPSNVAKRIYEQIRENGEVINGYLGIEPRMITQEIAERLGLEDVEGVLIVAVVRGSPAAKAGIEPGDVVIEWEGKKVADPQELIHLVAKMMPGTKARMKLVREGQEREIEVTVGRRPTTRQE